MSGCVLCGSPAAKPCQKKKKSCSPADRLHPASRLVGCWWAIIDQTHDARKLMCINTTVSFLRWAEMRDQYTVYKKGREIRQAVGFLVRNVNSDQIPSTGWRLLAFHSEFNGGPALDSVVTMMPMLSDLAFRGHPMRTFNCPNLCSWTHIHLFVPRMLLVPVLS